MNWHNKLECWNTQGFEDLQGTSIFAYWTCLFLKNQYDNLKNQNDTLKNQNGTLKNQNGTLKNQNDIKKNQYDTLRNQNNTKKIKHDAMNILEFNTQYLEITF